MPWAGRWLAIGALIAAVAITGTACTSQPHPKPTSTGRVELGETLDQSDLPGTVVAYDVSTALLGTKPTYSADQPASAFAVVGGCKIPASFKEGQAWAVALVPSHAATPAIISKAKDKDFQRLLVECR